MKRSLVGLSLLCAGATTLFSACQSQNKVAQGGNVSSATGWNYNDKTFGGFEVANYAGQQTGPGLAFVQGGRFTMGQTQDEIGMERNNLPRTVTVSSFYMDETEVANVNYREYIYWLTRAYSADYPDVIESALPDTTVWRSALAYNEPMVKYYFRHAAYNFYPVVGVNWYQASEFCKWRSDRVNELILIKNGILKKNVNQVNEDVYTTETYVYGQYEGTAGRNRPRDLNPTGSGRRTATLADGYFLPEYRLPTEAEWEYAALGLIGNNPEPATKRRRGEEVVTNRNVYPWGDPNSTRSGVRNQYQGEFLANYRRGRGDAMGVAGGLNDNADIPAPVGSYKPNAFGLYNMAGNVSEWVMDTYRPTSHQDVDEFRPFRGNIYEAYQRNPDDNSLEEKDSLGYIPRRVIRPGEMDSNGRYIARSADLRDFRDGDTTTNVSSYDYGRSTLVNNDAKVYKGGSWADRSYWLSPGTRRFQNAGTASSTIGFRCAMDRLGSPDGNNNNAAGNYMNGRSKSRRGR